MLFGAGLWETAKAPTVHALHFPIEGFTSPLMSGAVSSISPESEPYLDLPLLKSRKCSPTVPPAFQESPYPPLSDDMTPPFAPKYRLGSAAEAVAQAAAAAAARMRAANRPY